MKKRYRTTESGLWKAKDWLDIYGEIVVESDDNTHDALLLVRGDFKNNDERMAYARVIAKRLNAFHDLEKQKNAQRVFLKMKTKYS